MAERDHASSDQSGYDGVTRHPPGFRMRRGRNWFFIGLTYASYYFNRYNLSIAKTTICDKFGFSNFDYGMIQAARSWCYAGGQFFNGLLADRFGGRAAMAIGGYGTAVLNVLFGLAAYYRLTGPFPRDPRPRKLFWFGSPACRMAM